MARPSLPFDQLSRQELRWLAGILKDACRERLEKNLVSQAFEERLCQRGPVEGRPDPRPFLKIWEPRYRKFLDVANCLCAMLEAEDAQVLAESLREQYATDSAHLRLEARSAGATAGATGAGGRRKSRAR